MTTKLNNAKIYISFVGATLLIEFTKSLNAEGAKVPRKDAEILINRSFPLEELPASIFIDCPASRHGLKQKLGDNLALPKSEKAVTSITEALDMTVTLWQQLVNGNWNSTTRAGAKPKVPSMTLDAMETQFMDGVIKGITTWETAAALYKQFTGKDLPPVPEMTEDDSEVGQSTED